MEAEAVLCGATICVANRKKIGHVLQLGQVGLTPREGNKKYCTISQNVLNENLLSRRSRHRFTRPNRFEVRFLRFMTQVRHSSSLNFPRFVHNGAISSGTHSDVFLFFEQPSHRRDFGKATTCQGILVWLKIKNRITSYGG